MNVTIHVEAGAYPNGFTVVTEGGRVVVMPAEPVGAFMTADDVRRHRGVSETANVNAAKSSAAA